MVDKSNGYVVQDSEAVIKAALNKLGARPDLSVKVSRPEDKSYATDKDISQYVLLNAERRDGLPGNHWQLGNSKGLFIWDPLSGKDKRGRKEFEKNRRFVIIQ